MAKGKHNTAVPVIIGSNRDEKASPWYDFDSKSLSESAFDRKFKSFGTSGLSRLKQLYDASAYPYPEKDGGYSHWWWAAKRIATDAVPGLGHCASRNLARSILENGSKNVYLYLFGMATQSVNTGIPGVGKGSVIVPHAAEIAFVFGRTGLLEYTNEQELAKAMAAYWSAFAVTGDPNLSGLPQWPKYTSSGDESMRFDDAPSAHGIFTEQAYARMPAISGTRKRLSTSRCWSEVCDL